VAQNTRELGRITAACLLARIADPALPRQQRSIAPHCTCAAPAWPPPYLLLYLLLLLQLN
jgi:hypothetical protein